jgi:hypothetical protein
MVVGIRWGLQKNDMVTSNNVFYFLFLIKCYPLHMV